MRRKVAVADLVLVGGGHSHVHVLRQLAMKPLQSTRVTLITRDVHTPYSGMLPGLVAGHYSWEETHIDLRRLCAFAGVSLVHASATGLHSDTQAVYVHDGRPPVQYDVLSVDIGIAPHFAPSSGVAEFATPVKPIDSFAKRWEGMRERATSSRTKLTVSVVGGGAGGVELALAMKHRLCSEGANSAHVRLVTSNKLMHQASNAARGRLRHILAQKQIELFEHSRVEHVSAGKLVLASGATLATDECIWCTQASPQQWPAQAGLATDASGFIKVNEYLESISHSNVFAAGDVALMEKHPRPRAGVFAVRQGPPLERNLRARLLGQQLVRHVPQRLYLALVSTGSKHAVALYGSLAVGGLNLLGKFLWHRKDAIDKKFMSMYQQLPDMETMMTQQRNATTDRSNLLAFQLASAQGRDAVQTLKAQTMRCGGCGSKVGHNTLSRVLQKLHVPGDPSVLKGIGDDAAILDVPAGKQMIQTIDYFRDFVNEPYTLGRIGVIHALGDIWAMGAQPHAALVLATIPYASETVMERSLESLLAGACRALSETGCSLVGGHSSETNDEMGIGFSITGFADPGRTLQKSGMQQEQSLILTKPIGTGVLFAGDMRAKSKGMWIAAALSHMQQENGTAATILLQHGATAATDVTGFGVVGHLLELCRASHLGARVELDKLPLYSGSKELIKQGVQSSLHESNIRLRRAVSSSKSALSHEAYPLAFDPQTAGGLLASVPSHNAHSCLSALHAQGYTCATEIGKVELLPESVDADGGMSIDPSDTASALVTLVG